MRHTLVGVVGGGDTASVEDVDAARELGSLIAKKGWTLVNGGRRAGCMQASAEGAHRAGGLTIGLLPEDHRDNASEFIAIPIVTGLNSARNNLITLSSDIIIACPGGAGTLSEIALALKNKKDVILMGFNLGEEFYKAGPGRVFVAENASQAVAKAEQRLQRYL